MEKELIKFVKISKLIEFVICKQMLILDVANSKEYW